MVLLGIVIADHIGGAADLPPNYSVDVSYTGTSCSPELNLPGISIIWRDSRGQVLSEDKYVNVSTAAAELTAAYADGRILTVEDVLAVLDLISVAKIDLVATKGSDLGET